MTTQRISLLDDASLIAKARKLCGPVGLHSVPTRNELTFAQVRRELEARGYHVNFFGQGYQTLSIN
jgi:hypothetical protein